MGRQAWRSICALCFLLLSHFGEADTRIINGVPVPENFFKEVVRLEGNGGVCTGTLVGPRAILTAAHCYRNGDTVSLAAGGKRYTGKAFRHPAYPSVDDLDISLIVLSKPVESLAPISVGSGVKVGDRIFLLGHGCATPGGGTRNDVLRMGETDVVQLSRNYFITRRELGAAVCFGDSGGPALVKEAGEYRLEGVNSSGNLQNTNYSVHLSLPEVTAFLRETAVKENIAVCGINANCQTLPAGVPHFKKDSYTFVLPPNESMQISLPTLLDEPLDGLTWFLEPGAPSWIKIYEDTLVIDVTAQSIAEVTLVAKGKKGADVALLHISPLAPPDPKAPTCKLLADPGFITLGEPLKLELATLGEVTSASIDGIPVDIKDGALIKTPSMAGVFAADGEVRGPGGVGTCSVLYGVKRQEAL